MSSDPELVQRCLVGDRDAFGLLVEHHRRAIVAFCHRQVGDSEAAQDLAQEVFLRAYFDLHALREPAKFGAWLHAIAMRQCQSWRRRRPIQCLPWEEQSLGHWFETADDLGDRVGERLVARQAVGTLPRVQQETLTLKYVEGYSLTEIASRLQLPVETVRTRLRRAKQRLREVYITMCTDGSDAMASAQAFTRRVLETVEIVEMESGLTWPLYASLHALGKDWTLSHLMGVTGMAFRFTVDKQISEYGPTGALDWDVWFRTLRRFGVEVEVFNAQLKGSPANVPTNTEEEFRAKQAAAWEAVRASLDRGVPAIAWMPMTVAQKSQGLCCEFGLLVGYDTDAGAYEVRLPQLPTYAVPWDGFGRADPVNWFNVIVFGAQQALDERELEREAVRFAVEHAHSSQPGHGLSAYAVWRAALESGKILSNGNPGWARLVREARHHAAAFLREIADHFPKSTGDLQAAATKYDNVARAWDQYATTFTPPTPGAAGEPAKKTAGLQCIETALAAEQAAIAALERARPAMSAT